MTKYESTLAIRIRTWREAANLSKSQLADMLEVTPSTVHKWERSHMLPTIANMQGITEACGVSMAIFWGRLPEGEADA